MIHLPSRKTVPAVVAIALIVALAIPVVLAQSTSQVSGGPAATATPIKHVVVIYQENHSFDNYFGTYPVAANPAGEPQFVAAPGTPEVIGLNGPLLTNNPNLVNPFRLDRNSTTCSYANDYLPEQQAYDGGLVDKFVQTTGSMSSTQGLPIKCNADGVMGYYDGNTVTALWNYAQNFAMSDNFYGTMFGSSAVGAINMIAGTTHGAIPLNVPGYAVNGSLYADLDPYYDDCSAPSTPSVPTVAMTGYNVGNLLNDKNVTWGWFEGGFAPSNMTATGTAICGSSHVNYAGVKETDYVPHHDPFQYFPSTSNPHHLPPSSIAAVGYTDQANHQYDLSYFYSALAAGNLPSVSFLKAAKYQDGHPGYSSPLAEQTFLVNTINAIEKSPFWSSTAIIITYDDSGGEYDQVMPPIIQQSHDPASDALLGPSGLCGVAKNGQNDQCGNGPRLPFLIISPWAKSNFVSQQLTDQTSILKFIEDNWHLERIGPSSSDVSSGSIMDMFNFGTTPRSGALILDPSTGEVVTNTVVSAPSTSSSQSGVSGMVYPYLGDLGAAAATAAVLVPSRHIP